MEFTTSEIIAMVTVICTSGAAIAGVWANVRIARINAQSSERIRNNELYIPTVCKAVGELSNAYSNLARADAWSYAEYQRPTVNDMLTAYNSFISASYRVMSYVPGAGIQQDLSTLMDKIGEQGFMVYPQNDELYRRIMEQVMPYVQTVAPVKRDGIFRRLLHRFKRRKQ